MLTVNLFDSNFAQNPHCSVSGKTPKTMQWVRDQMEFDGITVFTDAYIFNPIIDEVKSKYKIAWLHEPQCLWPGNYAGSLAILDKFDFIITYFDGLLRKKNYRFVPYGGIWIPEIEYGLHKKTKLCSMLIGNKMSTDGHRIRHKIAPRIDIDFYGVKGTPVDYSIQTKVTVLKDYHFSVVTETCRQNNLFTEWLLDCFVVGTIPVFWGCPNVSEFFNDDGILSFATSQEAVEIVNNLSSDLYQRKFQAVKENFRLSMEYAITEDWMYKNIFRLL